MNVKHRRSENRHFPVCEELVRGELKATISLHQVEGREIPCWCYKTEGLAAYEQREVAFVLVRKRGDRPESYPREPLKFLRMLLEAVKEGSTVDVGGASAIDDNLTMLGFAGVGFVEAPAVGGLAMIGFTQAEVEALERFGTQRVFSLIGKAGRHFPTPYWSTRGRKSSISLKNMEASVLNTVMRIHDSGFSAFRENSRIQLRARRDERWLATSMTLRDTPVDMTFALLTELHPSCDGELNWEPGQGQPAGALKPGSEGARMGGSFVVIRPGQAEDSAQIVEDGYVLGFKQESWDRLRNAILTNEALSLETCELGWDAIQLPEGVEAFEVPVEREERRSWRRRIMLRESPEQLLEKIENGRLMGFIATIEFAVSDVFRADSSIGQLRVLCKLVEKTPPIFELVSRGLISNASMEKLAAELDILPGPHFEKGPVSFMVEFDIGVRQNEMTA